MGVITKIEDQKNKKRFNIFVDDAFFCGLLKEVAVAARLKVGIEINEDKLKDLIFESEVKSAFEKATSLLAVREHSKKEIYDKLIQKGYEKKAVLGAIDKLEEYHYVDDELFARHFIEQNGKYSKLMIENKLRQKGIADYIISQNLESIEDDSEYALCEKYITKYIRSKDMSKEGSKDKLIVSMLRKGFKFEVIKSILQDVFNI